MLGWGGADAVLSDRSDKSDKSDRSDRADRADRANLSDRSDKGSAQMGGCCFTPPLEIVSGAVIGGGYQRSHLLAEESLTLR